VYSALVAVLLTACGVYTFVAFIGAPNHSSLLLAQSQQIDVSLACANGTLLCRGLHSLLPFLSNTIVQAKPFLWYVIACLTLVGVEIVWRWRRRHTHPSRFSISPFHLLLTSIGLVWLLFTTLGLQGNARLIPEPTAETFPAVASATLHALQQSFDDLNADGCLGPALASDQGVRYHALEPACMQQAFATRILPQFLVVLLVTLELLVLGRFLLFRLRAPPQTDLVEAVFCAGLGACGWIVLLWVLGIASLLRPAVVWATAVLIPVVCFRHAKFWVTQCFNEVKPVCIRTDWKQLLLVWLLLSLFALNFLHVIRPIPLGFDDLNSYLMRPRAMASLGHSIYSTATFQWEYLTSLGFMLFGHDTAFGATAALMINWLTGPLAVGAILAFGGSFSRTGGLIAACLYYAMPMVSHFSYADMKVDNAVFFIGALATLALFLFLFRSAPEHDHEERQNERGKSTHSLLLLAGLFAGFAFAMKLTSVMVGLCLFVLLALVVWIDNRRFRPILVAITLFAASAAVGVVPWLVLNTIRYQEAMPLPVSTAPKTQDVHFSIGGINPGAARPSTRMLPEALAIDTTHASCLRTDRNEELDRYWGPDRGADRYGTLWWRTVMNLDVGGFYVTMFPAILLAPFVLLLPAFWKQEARWARSLALFTGLLLVSWTFLGNGVPWYGIGTLLGLLLGLELLISECTWRPIRIAAASFVALSITVALATRFNQFAGERVMLDYALGKQSAAAMQEVLAPSYGTIKEMVLEHASERPERPYLYQVGTFIPYFLADGPQHLGIADNQLGFFNCLHQEGDAPLTLRRLQALGFNSIIFDTGTPSIERDPNGSLHQKVNAFVEFANDPRTGVVTVINDPQSRVAFLLLP